jgi:hypothetical protein
MAPACPVQCNTGWEWVGTCENFERHSREEAMEILLTPEERELVREILQERQRALLKEIFRTDHHEYRDGLRHREKLLEGILGRLEAKTPAAA